ncbi:MAG: TlpA family protein disulfide reductase [Pseudomonadota bacterium]
MRKVLFMMVAALALAVSGGAKAEEATKAINFQFSDISGKQVQLSDFRGKWVLVNFWAPWCPLCWVEVPALNDMNKRSDFVVIGIGLDYGPDENIVRDAAQRHNMDFHAVVAGGARRNPDSPFRQVGPVDFYPTSYLYDPNGEIVMFIPGQVKISKILAFMDTWNAKKNVQVAHSPESPVVTAPVSPVQGVSYSPAKPRSASPAAVSTSKKTKATQKPKATKPANSTRKTVTY